MNSRLNALAKIFILTTALLLISAGAVFARDTVVEINQAKAKRGRVTQGDAKGFPVSINSPGSYRLTGNLTVPDENTTAIEIAADNVTLDLNGFAIIGPTQCSGPPVICIPIGGGIGIADNPAVLLSPLNVTVLNGSVRGMGSEGIRLVGIGVRIEGINAYSNGQSGIFVGESSSVKGNIATLNGNTGIFTGNGSTVTGNVANRNPTGINTNDFSVVSGNSASRNDFNGIVALDGSAVIGNAVYNNGGFGLVLGTGAGHTDNAINNNTGGTVNGGVQMGTNVCNGNTVCP